MSRPSLTLTSVELLAADHGFELEPGQAAAFSRALSALFDEFEAGRRAIAGQTPPPRALRSLEIRRPTEIEDPVNAFIHRFELDPEEPGVLEGQTVGVKDLVAIAGVPRTRARIDPAAWDAPDYDATLVTRILQAGGRITGTLNLDLWACGATGESSEFGLARNPHGEARLPGGSSSGSGSALAAGLVDLAIGTDTGGSARIPASWCGVVGLKPTLGAVPAHGIVGIEPSFDAACPMARTVDSCATFFEVLSGRSASSGSAVSQRLRIGVVEGVSDGCDSASASALAEARDALRRAGHRVTDVKVDLWANSWSIVSMLLTTSVPYFVRTGFQGRWTTTPVAPTVPGSANPPQLFTLWALALSALGDEANTIYHEAQSARVALSDQVARAFESYDILLTPTTPTVAPLRAPKNEGDLVATASGAETAVITSTLTTPANLTGIPAIAVPFGLDQDGMPRSVQLHAAWDNEAALFAAARIVESLAPASSRLDSDPASAS